MRALLIEDDADLAHWLLRALASGSAQDGFHVEWANDAELGERRLAVECFDCVVLDLGLPGIGGETLLRRLRARDDRTPILVLTASGAVRTRVEVLRAGADDFLAKPFAVEELEARLAEWQPRVARPGGGYDQLYHDHVEGADTGADFDFLKGCRGSAVGRDSH